MTSRKNARPSGQINALLQPRAVQVGGAPGPQVMIMTIADINIDFKKILMDID